MGLLTIREVGVEAIPLIHQLATQAFPHTYQDILSAQQLDYMMEMMYSHASLQQQIEEERHRYYIVYEDEVAQGYLSIEQQCETLFHLQKIYVLPHTQGKGVGRFLIEKAFDITKQMCPNKPYTLELNVNRHNKAVDFYHHVGFEVVRCGDFDIGGGYLMCDYIMSITL